MRILIYKRTHRGDPNRFGRFGVYGCMGAVRGFEYDAVIGVGGMGREPRLCGIAGRINWIGIGPKKIWRGNASCIDSRGPQVKFEKFSLWESLGPLLHEEAPLLARRLYEKKARYLLGGLTATEQREAEALLGLIDNNYGASCRSSPATNSIAAAKCPSLGSCMPLNSIASPPLRQRRISKQRIGC